MSIFKNRTAIGIICIVVALVVCFVVAPLFTAGLSERADIVRISKPLKTGTQITADMLQIAEVGGYNLPDGVLRDKTAAVGKYAAADLFVGDYLLSSKLTDAPTDENAYLYKLNGDAQAMSVTVKGFANGLSGKLRSGDIVSVIAPDFKKQGVTIIPPRLQYVEVVAVTANTGYDANTDEQRDTGTSEDEEKELPATVTLLVTPDQSKILAELEADGKLHLSLVYRGDAEQAAKFIKVQEQIALKCSENTVPESVFNIPEAE